MNTQDVLKKTENENWKGYDYPDWNNQSSRLALHNFKKMKKLKRKMARHKLNNLMLREVEE